MRKDAEGRMYKWAVERLRQGEGTKKVTENKNVRCKKKRNEEGLLGTV